MDEMAQKIAALRCSVIDPEEPVMSDIVERLRQKERDYYRRDTGGAFGMGPILLEAADEIERLRGLLRNVLDAGEAEAKAEAEMRNAQRNYTNPRPYVDAWEQAMLAASNAEKEARAALAADQPELIANSPTAKGG